MTMSAEISAGFRQVAADQIAQDIDNNAKFAKVSALAKVATTGSYNDLTDKPSDTNASPLKRFVSATRIAVVSAGTVFLVPEYAVGGKSLTITLNGVMLAVGVDYTEESATSVKFSFDLKADDVVVATSYGTSVSGSRAMQVSASRDSVIAIGELYEVPKYALGENRVRVYLNGLEYVDFSEVDTTHISFDIAIPTDMQIIVEIN